MAESFHVPGPTTIQVSLDNGATFTTLGHTDNDDLVAFEMQDLGQSHTSNDLGAMVAERTLQGSQAALGFTLAKWDETVFGQMLGKLRRGSTGATEGLAAEVGKMVRADSRWVSIKVLTTRTSEKSYTFHICHMPDHRQIDHGPTIKRLALTFESLPVVSDPEGSVTGKTGYFYSATANS